MLQNVLAYLSLICTAYVTLGNVISLMCSMSGNNVNFICAVTDSMPLDRHIVIRRIKFMEQIKKLHTQHIVLYKIYQQFGRKELHWLRSML